MLSFEVRMTQKLVGDVTPPYFGDTCPGDMNLKNKRCENKVLLNFTVPTAVDNSGYVKVDGPETKPPIYLAGGQYTWIYTASDASNNEARCQIAIGVQDVTPPYFGDTCPGDMNLKNKRCENKVLLNFTVPTAVDNSGYVKVDGPETKPPIYLAGGQYTWIYTASDASNNEARCQIAIGVQVVKCPTIKVPHNGEVTSKSCGSLYGSEVQFVCKEGFKLMGTGIRTCGPNGEWEGGDVQCIAPVRLIGGAQFGTNPAFSPPQLLSGGLAGRSSVLTRRSFLPSSCQADQRDVVSEWVAVLH
uniref:Sushi domain-containing protein n=1 Tax=Branchiostoma floridae TaxID=7739 RepID=C3ZCU4_BRAFL|eukprot:XP_002593586.1 hypothetical protein BRAFLDRAFT_88159 [Branchiostoma floridae]